MATQPKFFDIEDTQTGKVYRVETDDPSASYDEAVEYFSGLPETDWAQYEYQSETPAPRTGSVQLSGGVSEVPQERRRNFTAWDSAAERTDHQMVMSYARAPRSDVDEFLEGWWRGGKSRKPADINAAIRENFPDLKDFVPVDNNWVAAVRRKDADNRKRGTPNSPIFGGTFEYTGESDPTAPETWYESLASSAVKGAQNIANSGVGLAGWGASVVGAEETAEDLLARYINNQAAIEFARPDAVGTLDNLEWDNASQYGAEAIGELLPSLAGSAGAGFIGKKAAGGLSGRAAEVFAGKTFASMVEDAVTAGMPREIAENLAAKVIAQAAAKRGVAAGVAAQSIGEHTGRIFGDTFRNTGEMATVGSLIAGIGAGSLDSILPMRFLNNLGINGQVTRRAFSDGFAKAGFEAAKSGTIEGFTEAIQEFIAELPTSYITGESPFTAEMLDQMINAGVKAFIGGSAVGAASSAGTKNYRGPETQELQEREATIPMPTATSPRTRTYTAQREKARQGIERVAGEISGQWENSPNVTTEASFAKTPFENDALGVYTGDGNIALNTEAIVKEARELGVSIDTIVESVMFHEALGHYGLETLYGEQLDTKLWEFYNEGDPRFRRMVEAWIDNNPDAYLDAEGQVDVIRATEEVLAEMSQVGNIPRSILDELINLVKNFMRDMGMGGWSRLKYSEREIRSIIAMGQAKVVSGEVNQSTDQQVVKYSRQNRDTTSAGFTRRKVDDRSKAEARKQFWDRKQKAWEEGEKSSDPKYARSRANRLPKNLEPLTIEELTAEDLFNSLNADDILKGVVENYTPQTMSIEDMQDAALLRQIPPSAVQKWVEVSPGQLAEKLFAYDIAAQKLNDKITRLYEKIQSGRYNYDDKINFVKASLAFNDLTAKLFGYQSELGRALRAIQNMQYSRNNIVAIRDVLSGLNPQDKGGLEGLDDPATFEKYAKEVVLSMEQKTKESSKADAFASVLNTPRSIMASYDLSAPLRQGLFFIGTKEYYRAWTDMFGAADPRSDGNLSNPKNRGEVRYNQLMKDIKESENFELMMAAKLFFSSVDGPLGKREEKFQSDLAQKVPGVRQSEIAYSAFLNKLRSDLFNRFVEDLGISTKKVHELTPKDKALLQKLGSFINAGTGRGNLPKMIEGAGPLMNAMFFSPGLIASRLRLLNPVWYATLPSPVRKMALKEAGKFAGIAMSVLGFMAWAGSLSLGDDGEPELTVEWDPRSSDFLKPVYNNTHYDVIGGMAQYLTLFARGAVHAWNWSTGDKVPHRKDAFGELKTRVNRPGTTDNFYNDVLKFGRNKLAPNASLIVDLMAGENAVGEETTVAGSVASRMAPLFFQDWYELVQEEGAIKGSALAVPGIFGVGINTYVPTPLDPLQRISPPESFSGGKTRDGEWLWEDGENDYVTIEEGQIYLKPNAERMWEQRVNSIFQEFMEEEVSHPDWPKTSKKDRAEIISGAIDEAKKITKEQMLPLLELE
jgi:hypothetical protein